MMQSHALLLQYGFAFVAIVIFSGEIGVPILIPGEIALLVAGNALVRSPLELVVAALGLALIDLCATTILHVASRRGGARLLHWILGRLLRGGKRPEEILAPWRARLSGHDALVIFVMRTIPGIRISPSLVSGLLRLPLRQFLAGAAPASLIWVTVPLGIGYAVRLRTGTLAIPDSRAVMIVGGMVAALILVVGAVWWIQRSRRPQHRRGHGSRLTSTG